MRKVSHMYVAVVVKQKNSANQFDFCQKQINTLYVLVQK